MDLGDNWSQKGGQGGQGRLPAFPEKQICAWSERQLGLRLGRRKADYSKLGKNSLWKTRVTIAYVQE